MTSVQLLSRRRFCLCCLTATSAGALVLAGRSQAAETALPSSNIVDAIMAAAAEATIHIHHLRGGVFVLEGSGGNVAVLNTRDGKLLVDAGISVSRPQIATALETLGPEPVTRLINTHWHFDHSSGNEWLHRAGARILAHENTRKRLLVAQHVQDWNVDFAAPSAAALPQDVFATTETVRHGGSTLDLQRYDPAHTDGDISVLFREADILHTGDTFWNSVYPMIDYSTGGSIDGMIKAAEANLAATTERTIVIPGHGSPVSNRAGLQAYRDMLVGVRAKVTAAKGRGASLDAIIAERPTAPWDAQWGGFVIGPELFTRLVHEGL
jgi:glyoxylase-like metal-dependent hydrolase (beta-lactamase superfamily II)